MSDHDTADRALVERARTWAGGDCDTAIEAADNDLILELCAALARRIAEGERMRQVTLYYGTLDTHTHISGPWVQWSEIKAALGQPAEVQS